ncbi:MAG TPA: LIC12192 family sporadic carbohydrate cluster protein [Candidatus Baltobacteraceae bacterium]|jgi:sporadic carbohydrate cluster protein (TIGR04323 family)
MTEHRGARGYIASRPVRGSVIPQRVQNLVIRDYCTRRGLIYLVSSAEYAMPECYMMLENVLRELPKLEAIVCFSVFMLPAQAARRRELYTRILESGATLHAALENLELRSAAQIERFEDLLSVAFLLDKAPLGGRYEKTDQPLAASADPFVRALAPFIS